MLTIAIDPGASGGIAMRCHDGNVVVMKMPDTPKDIFDLLKGIGDIERDGVRLGYLDVHAVVECIPAGVFGAKDDKEVRMKMGMTAKLQKSYNHIEAFLIALGIPFESVSAKKWQAHYGAMPKEYVKRKRHIKDLMQRKHPSIKVTLDTADCLGILTYQLEKTK